MKKKRVKKKVSVFLYAVLGLGIFCIAMGLYLFCKESHASISIFPENPKQGDTVFIKVKSMASEVTGNFGEEKILFYRKGKSSEWISFLGIDADQKPGDYKISVNTSSNEKLEKGIKIALAGFTNAPTVSVYMTGQNANSNAHAISNIRNNDNPAVNKVINQFTAKPYFSAPFSSPLGVMKKSGFSFGQFVGLGKTKIQHLGLDLTAPEGTEIYAVNDGKVAAILNLSNYGKTVIIDHGLGIFSMYLHLDKFKVSAGDLVRRGQDIGVSGNTGYVTGPHLHFSMRVEGARVDPISFIEATQKMNDNAILADISNAFYNIFQ